MEIETVTCIAWLSNHWTHIVHASFDENLIRRSFADWVEEDDGRIKPKDGLVMWRTFLRRVSRLERKYFPSLLWVVREERGRGGRYHLHGLIGSWLNCRPISDRWTWGRCQVKRYNPEGNISAYICKNLSENLGSEIEVARFSGRSDLAVTWGYTAERLVKARLLAGRSRKH